MAWEWSHTQEAYSNVAENIADIPDDTLAVIWAEWKAAEPRNEFGEPDLNLRRYARELRRAHSLIRRGFRELMVEFIQEKASELATCTNGGWEAYVCPFGCGPHMVSFDR